MDIFEYIKSEFLMISQNENLINESIFFQKNNSVIMNVFMKQENKETR